VKRTWILLLTCCGISFLADVVGDCTDQPNLKQIFSKASPYSLLITEYVERVFD